MRAIIFDFDGVIMDSEPVHERAIGAAVESVGLSMSHQEFVDVCVGTADFDCLVRLGRLQGRELSPVELEGMIAVKRRVFAGLREAGEVRPIAGKVRLIREAAGDEKALKVHREVTALQDEILAKGLIRPGAVWRFYAAESAGEKIRLYETIDAARPAAEFQFPRQTGGEGLCLADFVAPAKPGTRDFVAMFVVTCGQGVLDLSRTWRERGDYLKSHARQSSAIKSAEDFAELLHARLRAG